MLTLYRTLHSEEEFKSHSLLIQARGPSKEPQKKEDPKTTSEAGPSLSAGPHSGALWWQDPHCLQDYTVVPSGGNHEHFKRRFSESIL